MCRPHTGTEAPVSMLSGAATGEDEAVKLRNSEQRRYGVETFQALKRILAAKVYATSVGDEGGSIIGQTVAFTRRSNKHNGAGGEQDDADSSGSGV